MLPPFPESLDFALDNAVEVARGRTSLAATKIVRLGKATSPDARVRLSGRALSGTGLPEAQLEGRGDGSIARMGFVFSRRKRLANGLDVNLSKSGASVSKRAGRVTVNSRGRGSVRIFKGLSFRFKL